MEWPRALDEEPAKSGPTGVQSALHDGGVDVCNAGAEDDLQVLCERGSATDGYTRDESLVTLGQRAPLGTPDPGAEEIAMLHAAPKNQLPEPREPDAAEAGGFRMFVLAALTLLNDMKTMPVWPGKSVVDRTLVESALQNEKSQAFVALAPWFGMTRQSAEEWVVISQDRHTIFFIGIMISTAGAFTIVSTVFGWLWYSLGATFIQAFPPMLMGLCGAIHWAGILRWGPATFTWSRAGATIVATVVLLGCYTNLAVIFVPAEQIILGSRTWRVAICAFMMVLAANYQIVAVPQCPPLQHWSLTMGAHSILHALRFADTTSDLEISDTLFKQVAESQCPWLNDTQNCGAYTAMAVGNLFCGLTDFSIALSMLIFFRFINLQSMIGKRLHLAVSLVSLVLQLVMLSLNVMFTFAIAPLSTLDTEQTGFSSRRAKLIFFILAFSLTGFSAVVSIIGVAPLLRLVREKVPFRPSKVSLRPSKVAPDMSSATREGGAGDSMKERAGYGDALSAAQ